MNADVINQTSLPERESKIMRELGEDVWRRLLRRLDEIPLDDRKRVTDHLLDDPLGRIESHREQLYEAQQRLERLSDQLQKALTQCDIWQEAHSELASRILERI